MMLHPDGGGIASGSTKQKLNTRSSTMSELVAVDNFLGKIIWCQNFMKCQGIGIASELYQDNESTILMCKKGQEVLSKRTRAMNVRYFAIRDCIDKGHVSVHHIGTGEMVGDFFTKPLQGKKFQEFRAKILGYLASGGSPG